MEILIMVIHVCFLLIMPPFKVWIPKEHDIPKSKCPLLFVEISLLPKVSCIVMFLPENTLFSIQKCCSSSFCSSFLSFLYFLTKPGYGYLHKCHMHVITVVFSSPEAIQQTVDHDKQVVTSGLSPSEHTDTGILYEAECQR